LGDRLKDRSKIYHGDEQGNAKTTYAQNVGITEAGGVMFLQNKRNGNLIEIEDVTALINPIENQITGRSQSGQEEQEVEAYEKANLIFPSGEALPRCWIDANYRGEPVKSVAS
jgi:hypothetical protein